MSFGNELKVLLTGDSKGLSSEMKKGKASVSGFGSEMKKIGGMLAGAFAVGSVVNYAKKVAGAADAQNKLARRLDISKAQADALELSFMKGGQTLGESEKSLDTFNRKLGELEAGEKTAADAFERLGLSVDDFAGKDYNQRLVMVKNSLQGMTASARAFASAELFGRGGGKKIVEGLAGLEEADKMIKEVNASLGITGKEVENIEKMNDSWTETQKKLELITTAVLTKLSPAIEGVASGLGRAAMEAVKFTNKFNEGMSATQERINEKGLIGGLFDAGASRLGFGKSDTEVMASAENRRLLASGTTSETELKQVQAKFDTNAKKESDAAAEKAAEKMAEETAGLADVFGKMLGGLKDAKLDTPEETAAPEISTDMQPDNASLFDEPMPDTSPRGLSEAGVTSASGLMGVALQGALGGAQSKEDKMLNVQEQMQRWLEQIARNTDARSRAYV